MCLAQGPQPSDASELLGMGPKFGPEDGQKIPEVTDKLCFVWFKVLCPSQQL